MHQNTTECTDRLALPAADAAKLLGISRAHLLKLHSAGQLPGPVRLARSARGSRDNLLAWFAAGAPPRWCGWDKGQGARASDVVAVEDWVVAGQAGLPGVSHGGGRDKISTAKIVGCAVARGLCDAGAAMPENACMTMPRTAMEPSDIGRARLDGASAGHAPLRGQYSGNIYPLAGAQTSMPTQLGLTAAEAAEMFGVSRAHWLKQASSGRVPAPFRIGRSVRWNADELRAWAAAGAPPRARWEHLRRGGER